MTPNRVTPEALDANIQDVEYHTFSNNTMTICLLTLANGFVVTGESACVDPANFNVLIGRQIARENAIRKIWPLMGYHIKQSLFELEQEKARLEAAGATA